MKKVRNQYVKIISVVICLVLVLSSLETNVLFVSASDVFRWQKKENNWYYMDSDTGKYHTGWLLDGSTWYYLDKDTGVMKTGWFLEGDVDRYYLGSVDDGAMRTGWQFIDGNWYYFHASGRMATGWLLDGSTWYYLDNDTGVMKTGWLSEGSALYYLQPNGAMLSNDWKENSGSWYYLGADGSAVKTSWVYTNGYWYFIGADGVMVENEWIKDGAAWYYLGEGGRMHTGWIYENDWYFLGTNGALVLNGWGYDGNGWYYLGADGKIMTGWQYINGYWYYLQPGGLMLTGWLYENGVWYYLNPSGDMETRAANVNGNIYVFNSSGAMYSNGNYTVRGCNFTADASGAVSSCSTLGFPVVLQRPELPTGCEITALTMLINYYGYPVSKITMAKDYLPTVKSGYWGNVDLDYYFCGDPFTTSGLICGPGALVTASNNYFSDCGSAVRGYDITGASASDMYSYVCGGQPVVVMSTIGMANRKSTYGWTTPSGKYVSASTNDHGSVLIGWDSSSVTIACPLFGIQQYTKAQFEKVISSRGNRGMILQ